VVIGVHRRHEPGPVRTAAGIAISFVVLQVLIAGAMVGLHLSPELRSLHQAVGTALWISVAALATLASGPRITDIERIVYESPSRGEFATPEGVST
jgi:heme A synthase